MTIVRRPAGGSVFEVVTDRMNGETAKLKTTCRVLSAGRLIAAGWPEPDRCSARSQKLVRPQPPAGSRILQFAALRTRRVSPRELRKGSEQLLCPPQREALS